jgi:hypothetical protein
MELEDRARHGGSAPLGPGVPWQRAAAPGHGGCQDLAVLIVQVL